MIRTANHGDLHAVTAIYDNAVRTGTATFELDPPALAEMTKRFDALRGGGFPYLVADIDGAVAGYAYAGPYRSRAGWRFTVEDSVYVDADWQGKGVGRALLNALVATCEALEFRQMIAVIGDSRNTASIALHRSAGFAMTGTLHAVGRKHGIWLDTVLMQRPLGLGAKHAPPFEPGPEHP